MSLSEWAKNGWLKVHSPTAQEVTDLLGLAERDLRNARAKGLDNDWRFRIAYNAILQAGTAALNASGYSVPKGESHHFRAIGSMEFTIGIDKLLLDKLDRYRKRRSITIYDVAGVITEGEAKDIQAIAVTVLKHVREWLAQTHPTLLHQGN